MRKTETASRLPRPGQGKRGEDGYLGYLLRQAAHSARSRLEQALTAEGITHPQFVILTMVGAYPGISNAELSRLSLLTPPTVSVIVGNLARLGLLAGRQHPTHGRIRELDLTEAGAEKLKLCRRHVRASEKRLAEGLSPADEKTVRRWLAAVAAGES